MRNSQEILSMAGAPVMGRSRFAATLRRAVLNPTVALIVVASAAIGMVTTQLDAARWFDHTDMVIAQKYLALQAGSPRLRAAGPTPDREILSAALEFEDRSPAETRGSRAPWKSRGWEPSLSASGRNFRRRPRSRIYELRAQARLGEQERSPGRATRDFIAVAR